MPTVNGKHFAYDAAGKAKAAAYAKKTGMKETMARGKGKMPGDACKKNCSG